MSRFRPAILTHGKKEATAPAHAAGPISPATLEPAPITDIGEVRRNARVAVHGRVRSTTTMQVAGEPVFCFTLVDGSGELQVRIPGRSDMGDLKPSVWITAEGTVKHLDGQLVLWEPAYTVEPPVEPVG